MKKLSILVSEKCFGNCKGCYLDQRQGIELTADEIINFGRVIKKLGYDGVTLSGGDPLIRADIAKIVSGLNAIGLEINLDTIGKPITQKGYELNFPFNEMSNAITLVGIPLDGITDETIEIFRTGNKGMKAETLQILKILNDNQFRISINTVVHKGNVAELSEILNIISRYPNIKRWELHQFAPISLKAKKHLKDFGVSNVLFEKAIASLPKNNKIAVSPKLNTRKLNFKYLDFNGNFVVVTDGIKKTHFNIVGLSDADLALKISELG
jgi:molybdenum cofactor biosynthesis enzyme MoaA